MGTTADKLTYLNTTKAQIKDGINRLGGELTNLDTFREYKEALNDIYDKLPKVTGTGSNLSLTPTLKGGLNILPLGNAEQQTYTGKNLLPIPENATDTVSGTIYSVENGVYTINSTNSTADSSKEFNLLTNYTIKENDYLHIFNSYSAGYIILGLRFTDNTLYSITSYVQNDIRSLNDYVGKTIKAIRFYDNGISKTTATFKPIIVNNVSTATTWEPYVGGIPSPNPSYPQDVKVVTGNNGVVVSNKNIIPFTNQDFTVYGIRYYVQAGELYLNGTSYSETLPNRVDFKNNFSIILEAGNYYVSANNNMKSFGIYRYDNNNKIASPDESFTLSEKTKVYLGFYIYQRTFDNLNVKIMLEYGSTATSYIAHQEQSTTLHLDSLELCKVGDYQDYITGSKDNWKIVKQVGKYTFTGNETLTNWSSNRIIFRDNNINYKTVSTSTPSLILCNNYIAVSRSSSATNNSMSTFLESEEKGFIICDSEHNTNILLASFFETQYQANTPVILYYVKATPTEETITDTSLVQSLNELNELQDMLSYDGTTNITITSDSNNAQMLVQVSALKGE